jgi:allantoinase
MMSVGLHGRISGHPARAMALTRLLDYVRARDQVWICRRDAIARHWLAAQCPESS